MPIPPSNGQIAKDTAVGLVGGGAAEPIEPTPVRKNFVIHCPGGTAREPIGCR